MQNNNSVAIPVQSSLDHEFKFGELLAILNESKRISTTNKNKSTELTRKVPMELLALEWLNKIDASIETRAYFVQNFLPILVLGCEKVLKEAHKLELIEAKKPNADFNPINVLAQYIMRNNPKYNNQNETSPYVRTMREVYHELREQMLAFQENRLAKAKADVKQRRAEREHQEKLKSMEKERRKVDFDSTFQKWLLLPSGRLEISIIVDTLKYYEEHVFTLPHGMQQLARIPEIKYPNECYDKDHLILEKRILKTQFVDTLFNATYDLKSDMFNYFTDFLEQSANYFVEEANRTRINRILRRLFQLLDTTNTGYLCRRRILQFLKDFREKIVSSEVRDPNEWPVVDPYIKFELEKDFEVKTLPKKKEVQDPPTTDGTKEAVETTENEVDQAQTNKQEINPDTEPIEPAESVNDELMNLLEPIKGQDMDENVSLKPEITKDTELMFIKGCKMYYTPLAPPLNAFDSHLLSEKQPGDPLTIKYEDSNQISDFDVEFLNARQFLNLLNTYLLPASVNSVVSVNNLIVYLKDNYCENNAERKAKLEKSYQMREKVLKVDKFSKCFEKLDNEGSSTVNLNMLSDNLEHFKDGLFKEKVDDVTLTMREELTNYGNSDDTITKEEFIDYMTMLSNEANFVKFDEQVCQYLQGTVQIDQAQRNRGDDRKTWLKQMEQIGKTICESFDPLYKQLFMTLLKDAENYGNNKVISANVAILDKIDANNIGLKYYATTPFDSKYVLGKILTRNMKNVSFNAVDEGKPIYIPKVSQNSNIHFFCPDNKNDGSLIILPLKYSRNKIFGVLSIDTLQDFSRQASFSEHEQMFYKGVASSFAKAYAQIVFKNRLMKVCKNAIEWLHQRCKSLEAYTVYHVLEEQNGQAVIDDTQTSKLKIKPIIRYASSENQLETTMLNESKNFGKKIKTHVYNCALSSEASTGYFAQKAYYCVPLRNEEHKTEFILEIECQDMEKNKALFEYDFDNLQTVLYVLHKCQEDLLDEHFLGLLNAKYDIEKSFEQDRSEILFAKTYVKNIVEPLLSSHMAIEISEISSDDTKIPEMSSYSKEIIMFVTQLLGYNELDEKKMIDSEFMTALEKFDPTVENFVFNQISGKFNLSKNNILKELHELHSKYSTKSHVLRRMIDWICLVKDLRDKSAKIRAQFN